MHAFIPATPLPPARALGTLPARASARRAPVTMRAGVTRRELGRLLAGVAALVALPAGARAAAASTGAVAPAAASTAEQAAALRKLVREAVASDPTMAATLLRLAFHDAFTLDLGTGEGGANGSIRLETERGENFGLQRAVDVLEPMQRATGLGWGDTVAVAGAEAVAAAGGPAIDVPLGRPSSAAGDPRGILPSAGDSVADLRLRFGPRGFDDGDIVALCGAHTLGRVGGGGDFVAEPNKFKNDYFVNLIWFQNRRERGFSEKVGPPDRPNFQLQSDMGLLDDPNTLKIVRKFASDQAAFFDAFAKSYVKMVSIGASLASAS